VILNLPELSLIALVGPSGCGKSTFAARHFRPTEVLSSDECRGLVSDDELDQSATNDAFEVLHFIAAKRLARGRLTVIDATNVQPRAHQPIVELARRFYVPPVAIVFALPEAVCQERNRTRTDRAFGPHVIRHQMDDLRRSMRKLQEEGFRHVFVLRSPEEVESVVVERRPLWTDKRDEHGPFDILGDIHGCCDELEELLARLGYAPDGAGGPWRHPAGRKAVFLGDLVDRGPRTPDVLRIAMGMTAAGTALCVPGNHDMKLLKALRGAKVQIRHGLEKSLAQLEPEAPDFKERVIRFLDGLVSHYVLDDGRLVVAHAGMKEKMQGRASTRVRDFALYGETTGEMDELGLPVRADWAAGYRGTAMVVYGHTPVWQPEWVNRTINIDTGCVFGGRLTALRYPERELVSVPARQTWAETSRPFAPPAAELSAQQRQDELLDLEDVLGKRVLSPRLRPNVTIREENATAALEVMSRFAADPRWLIYLPPTMSPAETADREKHPGLLEHPEPAFAHFRARGVPTVLCEEKHMGSRAVVTVCRSAEAARQRFGVPGEEIGICVTRTGRRFFDDSAAGRELERELLDLVRAALDRSGFWERLETDWVCLDCELMPWSAKAQELIRHQYAAVSAAAQGALPPTVAALAGAAGRGVPVDDLLDRWRRREELAGLYTEAWRRYCWPVASVTDLRLAPFHILATEGAVHIDKDHTWHMETIEEVCRAGSGLLTATRRRRVDLADAASEAAAVQWWEEMTAAGGEGMVIKPLSFVARGDRGLLQPALKCRGREYLRIIYGPEYTLPENLDRLRTRGLAAKRSLALREFALGVEALERFVRREPLRRVHECVFGVLALESEPVDPRL
jgi:protein phosphatase